jgi:hypothetical protein
MFGVAQIVAGHGRSLSARARIYISTRKPPASWDDGERVLCLFAHRSNSWKSIRDPYKTVVQTDLENWSK